MQISPNVINGLRTFVRIIPLIQNQFDRKYIQDEYDLVSMVRSVKDKFKDTARMMGKQKYRNVDFDFIQDVKEEMAEWLLNGKDAKSIALQRKKHLVTYHLIIEPLINMFDGMSHQDVLYQVDGVINEIEQLIMSHNVDGNYDDALVARAQVKQMIEKREALRATHKKKRNRKPRQEKIQEEMLDIIDFDKD